MSDSVIRLTITFGLLACFVGLEIMAPARSSQLSVRRFGRHLTLAIISAILGRIALAGGLVGVALLAQEHGIGLLNIVTLPVWLAFGIAILAMDFAIWAQHLVLHRVPLLWRLHRVHHCDTVMDVSTALRFHPLEIVTSLGFKALLVMMLGVPPAAAFAFEIILGAMAMFTHANIALPPSLERVVRVVFITPRLHLIHHSPNRLETNSNYGFSLALWDRLFETYRDVPLSAEPTIGLEDWRTPNDQTVKSMIANPFQ